MEVGQSPAGQGPVELLQRLLRFDTTNPPGNEGPCIAFIKELLEAAGFPTTVLARDEGRPNLISRLSGRGDAPPLLLYGHVDVVTTAHQAWTHPPFGGDEAGGYLWGRGAVDMKGGIAMMLAALLRARAEGLAPAGDIVLAVVSDEEAGGDFGARYLVENHPGQFSGIRYAIGEMGGFPIYLGPAKFYAIQVAEKQICWLKATVRGPAGHGSVPMRGGTMARLARMLGKLDGQRLPAHVTPAMRGMLETMAAGAPGPASAPFARLLDPALTDTTLDALAPLGLGAQVALLDALLHNTANATMVHGGDKINVIPSEIAVGLDGRLLPGYTPDDLIRELQAIVGEDVAFEVAAYDPGPAEPDMGLFGTLANILCEDEPGATAIPLLLPGTTDGRFLARLGIQSYGFLPMNLPPGFDALSLVHGADERIPAGCLAFGSEAIFKVLERYSG